MFTNQFVLHLRMSDNFLALKERVYTKVGGQVRSVTAKAVLMLIRWCNAILVPILL